MFQIRTSKSSGRQRRREKAFSLTELMVAMAVLIMLLGILVAVLNSVTTTLSRSSAKIDAFAGARTGFTLMSQRLSQATLNTYWDYDDPLAPTVYRRQSDLHFLILPNGQNLGYGQEIYFQALQAYTADAAVGSAEGFLNACGFYVAYGSDAGFRPRTEAAKPERFRYRLIQALQPTEKLSVYDAAPPSGTQSAVESYWDNYWAARSWIDEIKNPAGNGSGYATPLAENVIAVVFWPRLAEGDDPDGNDLTEDFRYDSKLGQFDDPQPRTANQLPPALQVTLVTISEASAIRLDMKASPPKVIEDALSGRFANVAKFQEDLESLQSDLAAGRIEFDLFTTTIPLRESKWSDD